MSTRNFVKFLGEEGDAPIYFLQHWDGDDLAAKVANALDRGRNRWADFAYLARIIFSEMIKDEVLSETGYGISLHRPENNVPFITVNADKGTAQEEKHKEYIFEEFIQKHKK